MNVQNVSQNTVRTLSQQGTPRIHGCPLVRRSVQYPAGRRPSNITLRTDDRQ